LSKVSTNSSNKSNAKELNKKDSHKNLYLELLRYKFTFCMSKETSNLLIWDPSVWRKFFHIPIAYAQTLPQGDWPSSPASAIAALRSTITANGARNCYNYDQIEMWEGWSISTLAYSATSFQFLYFSFQLFSNTIDPQHRKVYHKRALLCSKRNLN